MRLDVNKILFGGRRFTATLTVSNLGLNTINAAWVDRLSLSNSSTNDCIVQDHWSDVVARNSPHHSSSSGCFRPALASISGGGRVNGTRDYPFRCFAWLGLLRVVGSVS